MNHINICPSCLHVSSCVLTTQKDKVWSCSEYDEKGFEENHLPENEVLNKTAKLERELV